MELFEESIDSEKEQSRRDEQNQSSEERDKNGMSGDIPRDKVVTDSEDKRYENEMEESFDGGLSEHED